MEVIKTLRPGAPGTKKLTERYGEALLAVRYRLDRESREQLTTIELLIDRRPANGLTAVESPTSSEAVQAIKIFFSETELREQIKAAGARWDKDQKVWWLGCEEVSKLGLSKRKVNGLKMPGGGK